MGDITEWMHQSGLLDWYPEEGAEGDEEPDLPARVTCRYCGQGGLQWRSLNGSPRLWEPKDDVLHVCDAYVRYRAAKARRRG